jgi:DNA adenine methylase
MRIPHPIPYQGSKRNLASQILQYFPDFLPRLLEPFAGSAALTIAAAVHRRSETFVLSDINEPLMTLWKQIIETPEQLADAYQKLWNAQAGNEKQYYLAVRAAFNKTHRPDQFLYLLARCVKAAIRYNSQGGFNQSADNRRKGRLPDAMRADIRAVSLLLAGRTLLMNSDYREVLRMATPSDLVYMDPPYQGVCGNKDPRYSEAVEFDSFVKELGLLSERGISFIVSYDGRRGNQIYGKLIPESVGVLRLELEAGASAQSTLTGKYAVTYESLYVSLPLVERLGGELTIPDVAQQLSLFVPS